MKKFYNLLRPLLGVFSILLGFLVSLTPIPLGTAFTISGIIMLSPEIKPFRSLLDWLERRDPTPRQWISRIITTLRVKLIPVPAEASSK
ncbi:MAG: hypothetical protein R3222_02620 [Balneolaceae bacterium]|nr:hypothetical protein [Balneolaceae bacterium]